MNPILEIPAFINDNTYKLMFEKYQGTNSIYQIFKWTRLRWHYNGLLKIPARYGQDRIVSCLQRKLDASHTFKQRNRRKHSTTLRKKLA